MHDLAARYGTPLYVYDAQSVRDAWHAFTSAFKHRPVDFHYAIVCNKNRHLVQTLHALGAGIHANTPGDAHAALQAGLPAHRIVYSGTNLTPEDFTWLTARGIHLNLDSLDQLGACPRDARQVGLRFLIDDETRPNRIGVTRDELPQALALAKSKNLQITGLDMYAGTNTRSTERFTACIDRLVDAAQTLPHLEYIDIGGGFGVPYKDSEKPLDVPAIAAHVSRRMPQDIRLVVEPGRILVAGAGTLLMRVVSVKERAGRRYVGVDSTVANVAVESVYHAFHRLDALVENPQPCEIPTDVCGNTTHSRDFIARSRTLPHLQPGDLLALRDVGAYGYAMSSHFLNRPRPAEVVTDNGEIHLTTRRETLDDLLAATL